MTYLLAKFEPLKPAPSPRARRLNPGPPVLWLRVNGLPGNIMRSSVTEVTRTFQGNSPNVTIRHEYSITHGPQIRRLRLWLLDLALTLRLRKLQEQ